MLLDFFWWLKNIQKMLLRDPWKSMNFKEDKERELCKLNQSEWSRRGDVPFQRKMWLLSQTWTEWQGLGRNSLSLLPPWRSHLCIPPSNPAKSQLSRGLQGWPRGRTQDCAGGVWGGGWYKWRRPACRKTVTSTRKRGLDQMWLG